MRIRVWQALHAPCVSHVQEHLHVLRTARCCRCPQCLPLPHFASGNRKGEGKFTHPGSAPGGRRRRWPPPLLPPSHAGSTCPQTIPRPDQSGGQQPMPSTHRQRREGRCQSSSDQCRGCSRDNADIMTRLMSCITTAVRVHSSLHSFRLHSAAGGAGQRKQTCKEACTDFLHLTSSISSGSTRRSLDTACATQPIMSSHEPPRPAVVQRSSLSSLALLGFECDLQKSVELPVRHRLRHAANYQLT